MGSPAVEADNLTMRFGDFTAVDHLSFRVDRGEVFGFLGANGAGKTTTIRMLCGLLVPSEGTVRVAGFGFKDGGTAIKSRVGYMSQRFTLYNDLTVAENLSFIASLRRLSPDRLARRTRELFDFIGFRAPGRTLVRTLPGGLKQPLALAAALLHDPEVLFLDEPTAGVAPAARKRFWDLIRQLAGAGKTVFVTTHYMDEAEQCGRLALMRAGRIIALGSPSDLEDAAFPEPLYELSAGGGAPDEWMDRLAHEPAVATLVPFGLRAHATARDETAWRALAGRSPWLQVRPVRPSLEDVFVRLVEGKDR